MEAIVCPMKWSSWPEDATKIFKLMRSEVGEELILEKIYLLKEFCLLQSLES